MQIKIHPLFERAFKAACRDKLALFQGTQNGYSYKQLLADSLATSRSIPKNSQPRVIASLCPNSYEYVISKYATWNMGAASLPLCSSHPPSEWAYFLRDAKVDHVLVHPEMQEKISPLLNKLQIPFSNPLVNHPSDSLDILFHRLPAWNPTSDALIIYTSGTTGKPKGVVHSQQSLLSQITSLVEAWKYTETDHILHVLPLHHIHGIVNALLCPLYAQGSVEFLCTLSHDKTFDADLVWKRFLAAFTPPVSLFMGVPAMYSSLLKQLSRYSDNERIAILDHFRRSIRLTVSGSSALPESLFNDWTEKVWGAGSTDNRSCILERYGMTEIGMALTNPLDGPRIPGTVGTPFPNVQAKLVSTDAYDIDISDNEVDIPGEVQIKSPSLFKEYLGCPDATRETMTSDGWFKTGDIGMKIKTKDGRIVYKILGRQSVDIFKVNGYKISALDIERELLTHEKVDECAVVSVMEADISKGNRIIAVIVGDETNEDELKKWLGSRMAKYKIPKEFIHVSALPRNQMGKINKKTLLKDLNYKQPTES